MSRNHQPDLLDMLDPVIEHVPAMDRICEWIASAGRAPSADVQPGDKVTVCTASRTYYVVDVHTDGTVDLRAAGETPGDSSLDYVLRVRETHCEQAGGAR